MTLLMSFRLIKAFGAKLSPGKDDIAVRDAAGGPVMWWPIDAKLKETV
jgi:hypothetical protein